MLSEFFLFLKAYFTFVTVSTRVIFFDQFLFYKRFPTFINDINMSSYLYFSCLSCSLVLPLNFSRFLVLSHFLHDLLFLLLDLQYLLMSSNATSTISPNFSKIVVRIELVCNKFFGAVLFININISVFPFSLLYYRNHLHGMYEYGLLTLFLYNICHHNFHSHGLYLMSSKFFLLLQFTSHFSQ